MLFKRWILVASVLVFYEHSLHRLVGRRFKPCHCHSVSIGRSLLIPGAEEFFQYISPALQCLFDYDFLIQLLLINSKIKVWNRLCYGVDAYLSIAMAASVLTEALTATPCRNGVTLHSTAPNLQPAKQQHAVIRATLKLNKTEQSQQFSEIIKDLRTYIPYHGNGVSLYTLVAGTPHSPSDE